MTGSRRAAGSMPFDIAPFDWAYDRLRSLPDAASYRLVERAAGTGRTALVLDRSADDSDGSLAEAGTAKRDSFRDRKFIDRSFHLEPGLAVTLSDASSGAGGTGDGGRSVGDE